MRRLLQSTIARARRLRRPLPHDRRVLEGAIFPFYASQPQIRTVLFVGCDSATANYGRRHFPRHSYWTLDPDATRRRFGADQHVVARLESLAEHFPPCHFDLVICNGVYGWGLDRVEDCNAALIQCHACLNDHGHLLFGWNDVPRWNPAPLSAVAAFSLFSRYDLPALGSWSYLTDTPYRHTYWFLQKRGQPNPAAWAGAI